MAGNVDVTITKVLANLVQAEVITQQQADILRSLLIASITEMAKNSKQLQEIDKELLSNVSSWQENVERRRELGCYEHPVRPRVNRHVLLELQQRGLLGETREGVFLQEPVHHTPIHAFDTAPQIRPARVKHPRLLHILAKSVGFIAKKIPGLQTPLPNRRAVANEIAHYILTEPAIIISNTPAIFNPFEFEEPNKNFTRTFVTALQNTGQPVYYAWNEQAIIAQLQNQLKMPGMTAHKLRRMYYDHFVQYGCNTNVHIYLGDNSTFTQKDRSIPFLTKDKAIVGVREKGDFTHGNIIYKGKIARFLGKLPVIGDYLGLPVEVAETILTSAKFDTIRRGLFKDNLFMPLEDRHPTVVLDLIDRLMSLATRHG